MSNQLPEKPLVQNPFGDAATVNPPEDELEAYFQSKPAITGDGDCGSCCEEEAGDSPGHDLPPQFQDPALKDEGLTLLARIGRKLTAFRGTGIVFIKNGKASLRASVPVKVRQLWHRYVRLNGRVFPAEPKPAPFVAVADECGNVHAVGGMPEGNSMFIHNRALGGWNVQLTGHAPKDHIGRLCEAPCLQLTGYQPLNPLGSEQVQRDLEVLGGEGVVILTKITAPPSTCDCCKDQCCCTPRTQTVAKVVPLPEIGEGDINVTYVLEFNTVRNEFYLAPKECCCPDTSLPGSSLPQSLLGNS